MLRSATPLLLPALLVLTGPPQEPRRGGRLDGSHAFYYPEFAGDGKRVLAHTRAGPITSDTYLRYLAGRLGTRYLEDLAFDIALTRECKARGLAKSAPVLARSTAAQRFHESGRQRQSDPDGSLQRKFANEALRQLRVDALVRAQRRADPDAFRALFDRRYGVDGARVRIRHVLVSFRATERRLAARGAATDKNAVTVAARDRAQELHTRAARRPFTELLHESDDRTTRTLLRDPQQAAKAGFVAGYNYRRYGSAFATAVRGLAAGAVSAPVRSSVGFHVVQLVERKTTRIADVSAALKRELGRGSATPTEVRTLRRALLTKYRFRPKE